MFKKFILLILLLIGHFNVFAKTCIETNNFVTVPSIYYAEACGEESPDSDFFEPKIRVRFLNCNLVSCIPQEYNLKWDGQCVTTVGPYLFPLLRMCARVAIPEDLISKKPADPGYTLGEHLDEEGATVADTLIPTSDGGSFIPIVPKLCLYKDPSFLEFSLTNIDEGNAGYDIFDINPVKQPIHKTAGMHPIVEAIVFFIDNAATFSDSSINMIASLFSMLNNDNSSSDSSKNKGSKSDSGGGSTSIFSILADALSFIGDIIALLGSLITDDLKKVGQLNRIVDNQIYGCVNIPLGPYPPPYCETLGPYTQKITLQNICYNDEDGVPIKSIQGSECVVSTIRNNYIHNSIRIGYDNFVPICKNGEDPLSTDKCVIIENLDSFASAKGLHDATGRKDIIKSCSSGTGICVRIMIPNKCSVTSDGCNAGFRVVYGVNIGSYVISKPYFRDDLNDCPSSNGTSCQSIWGINTGEFADISLTFEQNQPIYDITPLSGNISLTDNLDKTTEFTTSIVRQPEFNSEYSFNQDPKQFCVFTKDKVIGCKPRAPSPRVTVYECDSENFTGLTCSSDYFNPQFIAAYVAQYKTGPADTDIATDSTYAIVAPETVSTSPLNSRINLAGDDFEPMVTDYSYKTKPFSGIKSKDPNSIYGNYLDEEQSMTNGVPNPDAIYINGIEYINGKYHLGGKFAYLLVQTYTRCPNDPKMCVLTKLLNADTVRCSEFHKKFIEQKGMILCTVDQTSACVQTDSMKKIGGGEVPIRTCDGTTEGETFKCYDGIADLCTISQAPEDRVNPSPDLGTNLSDSQYFSTSSSILSGGVSGLYDSDIQGLRDKTTVERGYCARVTPGICQEQTDYSEDNGFAYWPSAEVGDTSIGVCNAGFIPSEPLKRKCIPDPQSKTFYLEPLYRMNNGVKTYTNMRCVVDPNPPPVTP